MVDVLTDVVEPKRGLMQSNLSRMPMALSIARRRNTYHNQRVAIIGLNDSRVPWPDRELLKAMCERIYGKQA